MGIHRRWGGIFGIGLSLCRALGAEVSRSFVDEAESAFLPKTPPSNYFTSIVVPSHLATYKTSSFHVCTHQPACDKPTAVIMHLVEHHDDMCNTYHHQLRSSDRSRPLATFGRYLMLLYSYCFTLLPLLKQLVLPLSIRPVLLLSVRLVLPLLSMRLVLPLSSMQLVLPFYLV